MPVTVKQIFFSLLGIILPLVLCVPFLSNPIIFDDIYFFMPGAPEKFFSDGLNFFTPRWWVYETLAVTFVFLGSELYWLRLGNLIAHIATAGVIYFLIKNLLTDLDIKSTLEFDSKKSAAVAAIFFAIHPIAVFTQGYLIQRTIVCATLFTLLSWLAFWHGLKGARSALWISCLMFVLALYAKEHAVMAPVVSLCLVVLYKRSGLKLPLSTIEIGLAVLLQLAVAIFLTLQIKGIIGTPYEIMTSELLEDEPGRPTEMLYHLSALNEAGLFFKYLLFWILPNSGWISIDIRESFPLNFASFNLWFGASLFVIYGVGCVALLIRGGAVGLFGLALLIPWLLFPTELSVVRIQEPFVLYRSYLWMPSVFIVLGLIFRRLSKAIFYILIPVFGLYLTALSFDRLSTFSHPYLVWNEAAQLLEKTGNKPGVFGGYRIYYNRGNAFRNEGMLEAALLDYERVLKLKPNYAHAYHQRGVVFSDKEEWSVALQNFDSAISLLPDNISSHLGRARALEAMGKFAEAKRSLQVACTLGNAASCGMY